jgi:spore coat protein U-like protein
MSRKVIAGVMLVTASLVAGNALAAGELQGQMNVQIAISEGCTVSNGSGGGNGTFGNMSFGEHADLDNPIDGRSVGAGGNAFGLRCSKDTTYSVALDSGQNASGGQRRMGNAGSYLNYELYQDSTRQQAWGNGSNGGTRLAGIGSGTAEDLVVYGRVPAQASPAAGTYVDTVQVTVAW